MKLTVEHFTVIYPAMEHHLGRLVDHVHIVVADLERSRKFYCAVLESVGRALTYDAKDAFSSDELFVSKAEKPDQITKIHLALQTPDQETVQKFYQAALGAGGKDNGAPGEREYHPGYYAAFVRDPDGNNIEAVYHGAGTRTAESVVVRPDIEPQLG